MKIITTSGKRKSAIARAAVRQGAGKIKINNVPLPLVTPQLARMRIEEAVELGKPKSGNLDISVVVYGGGVMSQADAARLAVAKGIVAFTRDKKVEKIFLEYDRTLLVADVRRKETRKPNAHGKARAKRQKSYR